MPTTRRRGSGGTRCSRRSAAGWQRCTWRAATTAAGLDETSFLKATRVAPTRYVTGLVDLECGRLLEVVADRTRAAVDGWLASVPVTGARQGGR